MNKYQRYPLNVAGDFYVADGWCMACEAPEHEAPDLMDHDGSHCYFKRQPITPEELDRAIMAVAVGCCKAVRYGGTNSDIIRRITESDSYEACDLTKL